ncbi:MAG: FAD binding domain-containing protein [Calditrichaceae bacterium]|nr:FAD binding domain-containing protein [Calditrichia bacterium]NUQ40558.1 FAD binding domain-containing protein [Calditrichaceae bacterium]
MFSPIRFLLNRREIEATEPPGMLVLDFLRRREMLMGTKEGCKEGDCGACAALVGELSGGEVRYTPVTSCLLPLGELAGKHLVTVEGLNMQRLSPVQDAIVSEGAAQCGFCTPGIVVSLTARLMEKGAALSAEDVKYALSGHLCRCTGYASLKRAGELVIRDAAQLGSSGSPSENIALMIAGGMLPEYFREIPERLRKIQFPSSANGRQKPEVFIAGGTDLYVQRGETLPDMRVEVLNLHPEMKGVFEEKGEIHAGALTTFEEFAAHPLVQQAIPEIRSYMHRNASWQIRNRATLGGNIVNASPIGDMTILLLVLDTSLTLKNGQKSRKLPLAGFYKGYKQLAKKPAEIVTEIVFPKPSRSARVNFEKVSKRKCLDIASVNSAIQITAGERVIQKVNLSLGGVAPIPLFLRRTCEFLAEKEITPETIVQAAAIAQQEISPISDVRGSAEYKRLLTRQLLFAHFAKLYPGYVIVRELLESGLIT